MRGQNSMQAVKKNYGSGTSVPPTTKQVEIYFLQKGCSQEAAATFFHHFEAMLWRGKSGKPIRNWKTRACDWIWEMKYGSK